MDEVQAAILLAKRLMKDPPGDEAKLLYAGGGYVPGANLPIPELVTPKKAPPPSEGMNPLALLGSLAGLAKNVSTVGQTVSSLTSDTPDTSTATTPTKVFDDKPLFSPPSNFSTPAEPGDKAFSPPRTFQNADATAAEPASLTNPKPAVVARAKDFDAPEGVDPRLAKIMEEAIKRSGLNVNLKSGYRPGDKRFHGKGLATDWTIIGEDGKPLADYQSPQTFAQYQQLADHARAAQMDLYPDLNDQFRWGGYFSGGKGKYGALDLMHFDLGGSDRLGMAGGDWENGLTPEQARIWGLKTGKLYAAGGAVEADKLDLRRAAEARERAGGAAGPESAYMPGVPRAVHAAGGKAEFLKDRHPDVPDVLYHGTKDNFGTFDRSQISEGQLGFPMGELNHANHFANSEQGGNIMPLHANIKNPIRLRDRGGWSPWDITHQLMEKGRITREHGNNVLQAVDNEEDPEERDQIVIDLLRNLGHDGIVYMNRFEGLSRQPSMDSYSLRTMRDEDFHQHHPDARDSYIAFKPNQIKSATGNNGDFDPDNDDITKAAGGAVKALADWHKDADPEFKNADGSPKVYYHRTSGDFSHFKVDHDGPSGPAIWVGEDPHNLPQMHNRKAEGDNIMPVHVKASNPLLLDQFNHKEMTDRFASGDREFPFSISPKTRDRLLSAGFDGIVNDDIYGNGDPKEVMVFHPHQIKSATGNRGTYDPNDDDITKAEGGAVSMHAARLARTGINSKDDFWQRWQDHLTAAGNPNPGLSMTGNDDRVSQQAAKLVAMHRATADDSGIESVLASYGRTGGNEVVRSKMMHDILSKAGIRPTHENAVAAYNSLPDDEDRAERASGGRLLNKAGMYSKAAEVARALPQATGTVDQMMAMLKKAGVKQAELENAGRPPGDTISREDLAKHFERNLPPVEPIKLGAPVRTPAHIIEAQRRMEQMRDAHDQRLVDSFHLDEDDPANDRVYHPDFPMFTHNEAHEYHGLQSRIREFNRQSNQDQTKYGQYTVPGGENYQEHLLTYPKGEGRNYGHWDHDNVLAHVRVKDRPDLVSDEDAEAEARRFSSLIGENWDKVPPNSQKHYIEGARDTLRGDRDAKSLHVEEVQSDWGQTGRTEGFRKPITAEDMEEYRQLAEKRKQASSNHYHAEMAFRDVDKEMAETLKPFFAISNDNPDFENHPDYPAIQAKMKDVFSRRVAASEAHDKAKSEYEQAESDFRSHPAHPANENRGVERAPYVGNTQQWVDLALKHVFNEAVKGGYDRVSFSPGEANADHYGLRKMAHEVRYAPDGSLQYRNNGGWWDHLNSGKPVPPEEIAKHIGDEHAQHLLASEPDQNGYREHVLEKPTYVGGDGMINFYNNIVRKAVEKHAQMHDPDAKLEPFPLQGKERSQQYQGFSVPITDKIKDSVSGGLPAFANGGRALNKLGLYSKAAEIVRGLPQDKGTTDQMLAMAKKAGAKSTEFQRAGRPGVDKIDRETLAKHFEDKVPNLSAQNVPIPKYEKYTLPGGTNYRERLITLPTNEAPPELEAKMKELRQRAENFTSIAFRDDSPEGKAKYAEYLKIHDDYDDLLKQKEEYEEKNKYTSSHWDTPNVVAHLRMKDRVGPNGEKVLHVEEIQSDWGQDARKKGIASEPNLDALPGLSEQYEAALRNRMASHRAYREHVKTEDQSQGLASADYYAKEAQLHAEHKKNIDEVERIGKLMDDAKNGRPGVPDAPYIGNTDQWTQLGLKEALRHASEGGYDRLAVTPGDEQAKRYSIGSHGITGLAYHPEDQELSFLRPGSGWMVHPDNVQKDRLGDYVGEEVAQRLMSTEPHPLSGNHILEGEDNLSVGGEGMRNFYDKIVPKHMAALTGQKVEPVDIDGQTLHSVALDPETRNNILLGQSAYQRGGIALERLRKSKTDRT